MVNLTLKMGFTRKIGFLRFRQLPDRHHHKARGNGTTTTGGYRPVRRGLIVGGGFQPRAELNVLAQLKLVCDMADVVENFALLCVALGPAPLLLKFFRKPIGIVITLNITAGARIAIVVPDTADFVRGFDDSAIQPLLSQGVQGSQARKSGTDDQYIDHVFGHLGHLVLLLVVLAAQPGCISGQDLAGRRLDKLSTSALHLVNIYVELNLSGL